MAYPVMSPAGEAGGSQVTRIECVDNGTALIFAGAEGTSSMVLQYTGLLFRPSPILVNADT